MCVHAWTSEAQRTVGSFLLLPLWASIVGSPPLDMRVHSVAQSGLNQIGSSCLSLLSGRVTGMRQSRLSLHMFLRNRGTLVLGHSQEVSEAAEALACFPRGERVYWWGGVVSRSLITFLSHISFEIARGSDFGVMT